MNNLYFCVYYSGYKLKFKNQVPLVIQQMICQQNVRSKIFKSQTVSSITRHMSQILHKLGKKIRLTIKYFYNEKTFPYKQIYIC